MDEWALREFELDMSKELYRVWFMFKVLSGIVLVLSMMMALLVLKVIL